MTVRRGQGYTLCVSAVTAVHRQLLSRCQPLDGGQGAMVVPAQRKARRENENRVNTLAIRGRTEAQQNSRDVARTAVFRMGAGEIASTPTAGAGNAPIFPLTGRT